MEASAWKYTFATGDCLSCTHNLMGWRVYWTLKKIYAVARNFCSLLWKEFFSKLESEVYYSYYSYKKITPLLNFRIVAQTLRAHDNIFNLSGSFFIGNNVICNSNMLISTFFFSVSYYKNFVIFSKASKKTSLKFSRRSGLSLPTTEAVTRRCSVKKVF